MIYRIRVVSYCTAPGCRCDDRSGIVLYDGHRVDEALWARRNAPYPHVEMEYRGTALITESARA